MADQVRQLLDQFGEPVPAARISALREETAPPGAALGRPPFSGHLAFGMDPGRLGAVLRAADSGNSYDWMILAEEIEELFPHYQAVLSKRRRQVAQLPITVQAAEGDPAYEKHATFVKEWLRTGVLQRYLFDMTDALGKGYSVGEIVWETEPGCFRPSEILYRPQRFFEISWQDGQTIWLRPDLTELAPHKFLVHRHPCKSGHIVRSGLTRTVAFLWLYASYNAKDWALFCQGYGMPIRVGRYGPEASEQDKRVLWRAVSSIAGDVAAMIPKSMGLEFVRDGERTAGAELYLKRGDWLNREVSKLVLGGTAGTEAINGGHAVGKEHREGEQDIEDFDASLLSVTINRQIVQAMIAFTFGPQKSYPDLTLGRPAQVPLKDLVESVADLGPLGLKVKATEIRDRLFLTAPGPEDEVIGGAAPAPVAKPDIPAPARRLPTDGFAAGLRLLARHTEAPPELVAAMTDRLADEAAGALHGMTEQVRQAVEQATDLHDLAERVHALNLAPDAFAEAMARGMALANLAGQAAMLDELRADPDGRELARHAPLDAAQRDALRAQDFAVPETQQLPIRDARHVKDAWREVDSTRGLTPAQRRRARRRILARAKRLGIDTSGWETPAGGVADA